MFSGLYKAVHKMQLSFSEPTENTINSVNLFYINLLFFFKEVYFFQSTLSLADNFLLYSKCLQGNSQEVLDVIKELKGNRDSFVDMHPIPKKEVTQKQGKIPIILKCEDYLKCAFDIKQQYSQLSLLNLNLANSQRIGGVASYDVGSAEENWCRLSDLFIVMLLDHIKDAKKKSQLQVFIFENLLEIIRTGKILLTSKNYSEYASKMTELLHDIEITAYKIDLENVHYNPIVITRDPYQYYFENILNLEEKPLNEHYSKLIPAILTSKEPLLGKFVQFFISSGTDKAAVDNRMTALFDRAASNESVFINSAESELLMKATIQQIIDEAYVNKIDIINLSAFGCGAFKGDARLVAGYFRDVFNELVNLQKLQGKIIHFGIYSDNFFPFVNQLKLLDNEHFSIVALPDKAITFVEDNFCFIHDALGIQKIKPQLCLQILCDDVLRIDSDILVIAISDTVQEKSTPFFKKFSNPEIIDLLIQREPNCFCQEINRINTSANLGCASKPVKLQGNIQYVSLVKLPIYNQTIDTDTFLRSAYQTALVEAHQNQLKTITFYLLGAGKFKYPLIDSARIAGEVFRDFLSNNRESHIKSVILAIDPQVIKARDFNEIKEAFRKILFQSRSSLNSEQRLIK